MDTVRQAVRAQLQQEGSLSLSLGLDDAAADDSASDTTASTAESTDESLSEALTLRQYYRAFLVRAASSLPAS